jgi:hypothetical protein
MTDLIIRRTIDLVFSAVAAVIGAQIVDWGLSAMHVNVGLEGPYAILMALSLVIVAATPTRK